MAVGPAGLLIELNRMGKAVVIATHDQNLVRAAEGRVEAGELRIADGVVRAVEAVQ